MKDSAERKKSTKESPNDERKVAGIDKKNPVAKPTKNKDGDKKRRFSQKPRGVNHAGEKTTEEDRYKATRDDLLARFGKRSAVVKTPEKPVTNTPAEKKDSDMTLNDRLSMAKSMDDLSAIGEELEMLGLVELPRSVNEPFAIPFSDTRNCIEAAEALNKKHAELKEKEA